ncbi:unnamed protein product [Paramecium octaurelia]|uniref:Uncharacterized protein n=1 Tax=Paramecium octaurelia TaxID=43137 RepID=A0A8S1SA22_PAROT|nr:unnamed protein product [Paramecium octaurelia]
MPWLPSNSICVNTEAICATYTTQPRCDIQPYCGQDDSILNCDIFISCSDYTIPVAQQCYSKHPTCEVRDVTADGKIQCQNETIICSNYNNAEDCNFRSPSDSTICWFKLIPALRLMLQNAQQSQIKTYAKACVMDLGWNFNDEDYIGVDICTWNVTSAICEDAVDVSSLTSSNFYDKTSGYYYWDGNACSKCSGSSTNGYIMAFFGFILIDMF